MSGGMYERVLAAGGDPSHNVPYGDSGFTSETMPEIKYYDFYTLSYTIESVGISHLGDAIGEVNTWQFNQTFVPYLYSGNSWFVRGGTISSNGATVEGIFTTFPAAGSANPGYSFRTILR